MKPGSLLLGLYRTATSMLTPLIGPYLRRRAGRGKEDPARLNEKLGRPDRERPEGKLVWMHAASVGESLSALPLVKTILDANPDASVLMTTGTVTSAELMAQRLPPRAFHQFAPVDQAGAVKRFMGHWKPDAAIWVESELWPNMLEAVRKAGIPSALVNARLSEESFQGWTKASGLSRRMLGVFDPILAQTEETAARLTALSGRAAQAVGNLKAAASALPAAQAELQALKDMIGARPVLAAASTHEGEEELIGRVHLALAARHETLLTIIAPRHPERGPDIAERLRGLGLAVSRRAAKVRILPETQIYLMDTIGELGLLYRVAPFAVVGGSFVEHGGQNPLEPARLGAASLHGPHVFNFKPEYEEFDADGASALAADETALAALAGRWLDDPGSAQEAGAKGLAIAERGAAALERTKEALAPMLAKAGLHAPA
jgi:3-deoxy-D-manno-octulosonic-acid transferase